MTYYDFHKPEQNQNFQLILTSKVSTDKERDTCQKGLQTSRHLLLDLNRSNPAGYGLKIRRNNGQPKEIIPNSYRLSNIFVYRNYQFYLLASRKVFPR